MTLYTVTLSASGDATVTVDAIDVETAGYLALALARHPGMIDSDGELLRQLAVLLEREGCPCGQRLSRYVHFGALVRALSDCYVTRPEPPRKRTRAPEWTP